MTSVNVQASSFAAELPRTGPSFTAALFGFVSTTAATTMLLILLGSF